jgi:hypothetical protein
MGKKKVSKELLTETATKTAHILQKIFYRLTS